MSSFLVRGSLQGKVRIHGRIRPNEHCSDLRSLSLLYRCSIPAIQVRRECAAGSTVLRYGDRPDFSLHANLQPPLCRECASSSQTPTAGQNEPHAQVTEYGCQITL